MKRLSLLALLAVAVTYTCHAQYRIYGHVPNLEDGMMYLDRGGRRAVDSAKVEKGCFTLESKTPIEGADYVFMHHSSKRWQCAFWMANDNIDFTTVDDMPVIKGSKTQDEYAIYRRTLEPVWDYGRELKKQMQDVTKHDSLMQIVETTYKAMEDSAFMTFLKKYPASYISLNHIYNLRNMDKYPYQKYMKYFNELTPGAFKGKQWNTMLEFCEKDHALEPGQPMPSFEMPNVYGKNINLASFKGKYVLFTISSYGVGSYQTDLMLRKQLYEKYHAKGLEMVDYSLSEDLINVIKAPANMGLKWHFVTNLKGFNGPWIREHSIDHITQNFLIDPQGVIIGKNLFEKDLENAINNIFN
ncbi:MAG: DUF4369 domain-containing protein [Prevotella sp.]